MYYFIVAMIFCLLCSCGHEERSSLSLSSSSIPFAFVDPCTSMPGPNCCALAFNGLCEEPSVCSLGTDEDDCRGTFHTELSCVEAYVIEEDGDLTRDLISFTWSDQLNGMSYTSEPIVLKLPSSIQSLSISVMDGEIETGMNWALNDESLKTMSGSNVATGALPHHYESTPEEGCLQIWPLVEGDRLEREARLLITSRHHEVTDPILDVNVIVVGEADVTEDELAEVLVVTANIFESHRGPSINLSGWFKIDGESLIPSEGNEINQLRQQEFSDNARALNVFIIDDFTEGDGTLGIAGGVPGPNGVEATSASGLVVAIEPHLSEEEEGVFELQYSLLASTIAHELGHQLGLEHTTEDDGSTQSSIDDLESCAYAELGSSEAEECPDGRNLMFWTSGDEPQDQLSAEQVFVLNHNPIIY